MLRVTRRARWYRPPTDDDGDLPLTDDRSRFREPLVADGTEDEPDVFDIRERIPTEFGREDERPQDAGKRAKKVERLLAKHNTKVTRVEPDE